MADYNPNYMAAYQQYGQTMTAGGGGSNMSGTGSSTMQAFLASQDNDDKPTGLGAKPPQTTTTQDDGPSFWERITQAFTDNEVDVSNVYQPSVDPSQVYNQEIFKIAPLASDYVYRAEMSEQTQDMVEQAMGYKPPMTSLAEQMGVIDINSYDPNTGANALNLSKILKLPEDIQRNIFREMHEGKDSLLGGSSVNTLRIIDDSAMTEDEKKKYAPLIKMANEIANETITTTELPPIEGEEEASLMDALMEGQPTGLMSRPSSFTGSSVDVASNIPNWMQDLSAAELSEVLVGINQGTHDPETGQRIQTAEDFERETTEEFNARRRRERGLPVVTATDGDVVDTALTKLSDNTSMSKSTIVDQVTDLVGNNIYAASILGAFEKETGRNFTILEENLNYSLANAKAVPFSQAKINRALESLSEADRAKVEAGRNVEAFGKALMDEAYSGGSDYKGRGLIQITHDYNYEAVGDRIGVDLVSNPELVTDPRYAVPAALAYLDLQGFFYQ